MSNLLATLLNSSRALRTYDRVLDVTQNNVSNASTPSYVRQRLELEAMPFDAAGGTLGGVWAGEVTSARNLYAEAAVRRRTTELGKQSQAVESLKAIEAVVDTTGEAGIAGALSGFYASLSNWSMSANSASARQEVLDQASTVAASFRQAAAAVGGAARDAESQLRETLNKINSLGGELQRLNHEARQGGKNDAGLDANLHAALEELSEYVDFSAMPQDDGSVTVLLAGQIPLVTADNRYELSFSLQGAINGTASAVVQTSDGTDITRNLTTGRIGALLDFRNRVIAQITGGPAQPGDLNRLAQAVADRVNTVLTEGRLNDGPPPEAGLPLFVYDNVTGTNVAASLTTWDTLTPTDLAAIDPGPPYVSNGIALRLAALATPDDPIDKIDGFTFTEFYGLIGSRVGRDLNDAETARQTQQSLVAQAKDLRAQSSAVSLDEEATILIQFQRSYQAMAQVLKVLDELTQDMIGILR